MKKIMLVIFNLFICEKVFALSYPRGALRRAPHYPRVGRNTTWQNVLDATPKEWVITSLAVLALISVIFLIYLIVSRLKE